MTMDWVGSCRFYNLRWPGGAVFAPTSLLWVGLLEDPKQGDAERFGVIFFFLGV